MSLQKMFSYLICFLLFLLGMVCSIYLNDKSVFTTYKVNDIVTYDMLSEELYS